MEQQFTGLLLEEIDQNIIKKKKQVDTLPSTINHLSNVIKFVTPSSEHNKLVLKITPITISDIGIAKYITVAKRDVIIKLQ